MSLSREISKLHEETIRGSLKEVIEQLEQKPIKGEIVVVIAGKN
jgi:16S rRNA (cytidine1402-2'-O)-methyltransferase